MFTYLKSKGMILLALCVEYASGVAEPRGNRSISLEKQTFVFKFISLSSLCLVLRVVES